MKVDPLSEKLILDVSYTKQIELSKILNDSNIEHKTFLMLRDRMRDYSNLEEDSLMLAAYELISDHNNRMKFGISHQVKTVLDTSITYTLENYLNMGNKKSCESAKEDLAERAKYHLNSLYPEINRGFEPPKSVNNVTVENQSISKKYTS